MVKGASGMVLLTESVGRGQVTKASPGEDNENGASHRRLKLRHFISNRHLQLLFNQLKFIVTCRMLTQF